MGIYTQILKTLTINKGESVSLYYDGSPTGDNIMFGMAPTGLAYPNFYIYGDISINSSARDAEVFAIYPGAISPATSAKIENYGNITAISSNGMATGLYGRINPSFYNEGNLTVQGLDYAWGLRGYTAPVENSGNIRVTSGIQSHAMNVTGGPINNHGTVSAKITGSGIAAGISYTEHSTGAIVNNWGNITAEDSSTTSEQSFGIYIYGFGNTDAYIYNYGTIKGDYSIKESGTFDVSQFSAAQHVQNSGTLLGKVDLGSDRDSILNSGKIVGSVELGPGADLYDGRQGATEGLISGGSGDDTLLGGTAFDYLQGNTGNDSESGGDGDDWIVGGQDQDVLSGDAGADVMNGNLGNDTLSGGEGVDWLRGGQGDDSIVGGSGDDWISGDKGADTLSGGAGADLFNIFAGSGTDRVLDFAPSEGDRVRIEGGSPYEVKQVGGDTLIDLGSGDQLVLVGVQITASSDWIVEA